MTFEALVQPLAESGPEAYWFVFQGKRLVVYLDSEIGSVPFCQNPADLGLVLVRRRFLGNLDHSPCFSAEIDVGTPLPASFHALSLLELFPVLPPQMLKAALTAIQIVRWDQTFQYCGRCGTPTQDHPEERMKVCPQCELTAFPRLSPAVMVAVIREKNEILLANNRRFPADFFSVLAGFVEPGETLEECIYREVREEVGVAVRKIRYFGSQPWPFPDSLMIAFFAEYESGSIQVDGKEIREARWFTADRLPTRPQGDISIAGRLIDRFREEASRKVRDY